MPKFNDFIKGFEEKEETEQPKVEAPKAEEPKEANVRNWVKKNYPTEFQTENIRGDLTFDDLYKHMNESKDGEDFYQFASEGGKGFDSAVREEIFNGMSEYHKKPYEHFYGLWLNGGKQEPKEEPNSQEYEGYRLERTPDGKWINRDTYEYFDSKVEAQKDIDKFIASQRLGKPKDDEKGQRIVNYGGKDMTFDEAKEEYKKAVAIPTLKSTPEREAYLDKSAEYDIAQDELYKKWYEEKDPQKKAELKEQLDKLDKEYESFLNEWEEAERNRYKKD